MSQKENTLPEFSLLGNIVKDSCTENKNSLFNKLKERYEDEVLPSKNYSLGSYHTLLRNLKKLGYIDFDKGGDEEVNNIRVEKPIAKYFIETSLDRIEKYVNDFNDEVVRALEN